jgi:hypothetical protein
MMGSRLAPKPSSVLARNVMTPCGDCNRLSGGNTGAMKRLAKTAALEFLSQRDSDLDTKNTASWEIGR